MTPILFKIQEWDDITLSRVTGLSGRLHINTIFLTCSKSGNGLFYLAITAGVAVLDFWSFPTFLIAAVTAFATGLIAHTQIKKMVGRLRPFEHNAVPKPAFVPVERFSFPSGHTTHAFLMATLLIGFYPFLAVIATPWACMVGLSRVYFRVHYPSDILAGMILGICCAFFGLAIWL